RAAGTNYVWVTLDVNSSANQSNETNDQGNSSFTITAPVQQSDLVVQSISVSPTSGLAGSSTTLSLTVRNQGAGSATASTANVRISTSGSVVGTSDPLLTQLSIPAIAASGTYSTTATVTIPGGRAAGTNYVWVTLDVNSSANQSNETNDQGNSSFTVTAGISTPVVSGVSPSPVPGLNGNQTLTVNGSGFASGAIVRLRDLTYGGTYDKTPTSSSSGQLQISANFTAVAATWSAQVINLDGGTSSQFNFTVR
ncbi:MAG: CARDB domain-containing protein, partial [Longimicrobiales bacterium]